MSETTETPRASVDPAEIGKFDRMARHWWDPAGEMAALHRLNPLRIGYIRDTLLAQFDRTPADPLRPLAGLRLLDVGCGGGILAEPLARLGAQVTGIDAARETVKAARNHAELQGLRIDYRAAGVEDLAAGDERFDAVLAMEIVEHVSDVDGFLTACGRLVRPGGLAFVATLNRTPKSFLLAKVGAEYVLGWLPRGTHDWRRFVRPSEVARGLRPAGLTVAQVTGVSYDPLRAAWNLSSDTDVNYMLVAERPA
jgi:2-polyprenyl-6-hydroxyphenyl methylase/3-demethylubiquinone-9 3-methyltransferase